MKHRSLWTQAPPSLCSAVRFCAYWRGRSIRYQTLKLRMHGSLLPFLSYSLKHITQIFFASGSRISHNASVNSDVSSHTCQSLSRGNIYWQVCICMFLPKKAMLLISLGRAMIPRHPRRGQQEKWGSPWDQSTDSVSQADTEFVQHIQNPWASLGANIRSDRQIYKILEKSQNMTGSEFFLVYLLTQSARTPSLPFCSWQGSQNRKNSCTTDEDIYLTKLLMQSSNGSKERHVSARTNLTRWFFTMISISPAYIQHTQCFQLVPESRNHNSWRISLSEFWSSAILAKHLTSCLVPICQSKEYLLMSSFELVPNEKAGRKLERETSRLQMWIERRIAERGGGEDAEKRDSFLVRLNAIIQPGLSCFTQSSLGKSPYAVAVALDSLELHGA